MIGLFYWAIGFANLQGAILFEVKNLSTQQLKQACFWQEAVYKAEYDTEKKIWVMIEPENTRFIEELKKDQLSDPEIAPDCSEWEKP